MPRKTMLESVSMRTVLNLRPGERAALNALVQATGDFPARVVGALVLAAARLLDSGFAWFDLVCYVNVAPAAVAALVEIGQDRTYPPDVAVWLLATAAAGAVKRGSTFGDVIRAITNLSPTTDAPQSVTADVTD